MRDIVSLLLCWILLPCSVVWAEVFQYRDDQGRTHYTNSKQAIPEQYRNQSTEASLPSLNRFEFIDQGTSAEYKSKREISSPDIEIFVTSWCGYCTRLENYLRQKNVRFKKYDIEQSITGKRKYDSLRGRGVPVIKIGSEVITGFNPGKIDQLLAKNRSR